MNKKKVLTFLLIAEQALVLYLLDHDQNDSVEYDDYYIINK